MATSGDNLHIVAPHLLSRRRRISDTLITGMMWALYSYLWAPVISLMAWLLGFEFAYDVMVRAGGIYVLKEVLWWYGIMVASIFVVVATWSMLNRHRYASKNRRKAGEPVSDDELSEYYSLDPRQLENMRSARVVRVSLSDDGTIQQVEPLEIGRETISESDAVPMSDHK